jgi:hypothetical protein
MAFYRSFFSHDTWITNAAPDSNLSYRASGSNHGKSTSLNVFARKAEINSSSIELARTIVRFDLTELSGKIYSDRVIPSSSVSYFLKMFDKKHDDTVPTSYDLFVYPLSRSFDEGNGIDDDNYRDIGYANWINSTSIQTWTVTGSDFLTTNYGSASQHFDGGSEDLEVDVTDIVKNWLTGAIANNGLVIKLGNTEESNGDNYFKKVFYGRESKYVGKIPYLEARWNDVVKDNRNNFAYNLNNKLFLYNFIRGELTAVTEPVSVRVQDHLVGTSASFSQTYTAAQYATGIMTASLTIANTASFKFSGTFYDIWFSGSTVLMTGTFVPLVLTGSTFDSYENFVIGVDNLKRTYFANEEARLKVVVRNRDYKNHRGVLNTASLDLPKEYIEKLYYSILNKENGEIVVPFGTGSILYTATSYNSDGNYFNIWFNSFVPGFTYKIIFLVDINQYDKKIIDNDFIFKVL